MISNGHVVGPFGIVLVWSILRSEMVKVGFDVVAHGGIGILLNQEGRRCVAAKYFEKAGLHLLAPHPFVDRRGPFIEPLITG